jgi:hypothetical protein
VVAAEQPNQRRDKMSYSVKNVKTGPSREWGPNGSYTCNLYNGSKKIAEVFEAGDGGCLDVRWLDRKQKEDFVKFAESNTYVCEYDGTTETYSADLYIAKLVEDYETTKRTKRMCRTKTVVRWKGDEEGEFRTFKAKYSQKVKEAIEAKFGNQIVEIVNERFIA